MNKLYNEINDLMELHQKPLLRYAQSIIRDADGAQDIVQDTFLKYLDFRKINEISNAKAWLYKVTYNMAIDIVRKKQRHHKLEEQVKEFITPQKEVSPIELLQEQDRREWLQEQITLLGEREKELLQMKIFEEKSYKDIAASLNISVGHVGIALHRILKKLSSQLSQQSVGGEL